jgi:hypothetical protein
MSPRSFPSASNARLARSFICGGDIGCRREGVRYGIWRERRRCPQGGWIKDMQALADLVETRLCTIVPELLKARRRPA